MVKVSKKKGTKTWLKSNSHHINTGNYPAVLFYVYFAYTESTAGSGDLKEP